MRNEMCLNHMEGRGFCLEFRDHGGRCRFAEYQPTYHAEDVQELLNALKGCVDWEQEYRTINHLGTKAPHPFVTARIVLRQYGIIK